MTDSDVLRGALAVALATGRSVLFDPANEPFAASKMPCAGLPFVARATVVCRSVPGEVGDRWVLAQPEGPKSRALHRVITSVTKSIRLP